MAPALSLKTFSNEEIKEEGSSLEFRKSAKNPEEETRFRKSTKSSQIKSSNGNSGRSDGHDGSRH